LGKNYEKVEEKKEENAKEKGQKKRGNCSSKIKINAKGAKNKAEKGALRVNFGVLLGRGIKYRYRLRRERGRKIWFLE
jgi:hypothetical protein